MRRPTTGKSIKTNRALRLALLTFSLRRVPGDGALKVGREFWIPLWRTGEPRKQPPSDRGDGKTNTLRGGNRTLRLAARTPRPDQMR